MTEFVKEIPGYEGFYSCSSSGEIRRTGRVRGAKVGRILKTCVTTDGYPTAFLCKHNQQQTHYVHLLVWRTFRGEIPDGYEINHKDLNKQNPCLNNLEMITHLENVRHGIQMSGGWAGERSGQAILKQGQVEYIREHYKFRDKEFSGVKLARRFGVTKATISDIMHCRSWNQVS
jgi:hypothetical protein